MTIIKHKILLLPFIFFLIFFESQAQSPDSIENRSKRKLQYLDINMNDEKSMFKISPQYFLSDDYGFLDFSFSYETKLNPWFSFSINEKVNYYNSTKVVIYKGFTATTGFSFRYYYLMNRNILRRTSGNNMNGLYLETGLNDLINIYIRNSNYVEFPSFIEIPSPSLSLGLQKRINRWAFIDVFLKSGYNIHWEYYYSGLGFQIGLAL